MQLYNSDNLVIKPSVSIYGTAGTQKTYGIRTAPNPIVLSTDQGMLVLKGHSVPYYLAKTIEDINTFRDMAIAGKFAGHTVVIDDCTEAAEIHMRCQNQVSLERRGKKADGKQLYGDAAEFILNLIRDLRVLPNVQTVFLFKQVRFRDDKGKQFDWPSIPGEKVLSKIPHMTDEIWHAEIHETECPVCKQFQAFGIPVGYIADAAGAISTCQNCRGSGIYGAPYFRTQQSEGIQAKTRSGLPPMLSASDWSAVFNMIS